MKPSKQRFLLIKNLFSSFLKGVKSGKKTRFKILIFSNFFNKTFSWVISKRHVVISFIVLFVITIFASFFFINLTQRTLKLKQRTALAESYQTRIDELHKHGERIVNYNENYEKEIEKIFNHLGEVSADKLWARNNANLVFSSNNVNENIFLDNALAVWVRNFYGESKNFFAGLLGINVGIEQERILTLEEKSNRTRTTLQHLKEIETFFSLQVELKQHVPTGWPLKQKIGYKTSGYGPRFSPFTDAVEFHTGVDIAAPPATNIVATADGVVTFSGTRSGYGLVVTIKHKYGHTSSYAHNQEILVGSGEKVKKGQPVAKLGNSGRSTGPHLHYETKLNNEFVDPWPYLVSEF